LYIVFESQRDNEYKGGEIDSWPKQKYCNASFIYSSGRELNRLKSSKHWRFKVSWLVMGGQGHLRYNSSKSQKNIGKNESRLAH
jgi:hypothetical protein